MPKLSVRHGLEFFYTDSGVPSTSSYKTLILFHGYAGHSGGLQHLNPLASTRGLRLICINRRGYPGSTPFTEEEAIILNSGSEAKRAELIDQQGIDYALFVDGIIKECALPDDGNVALIGFSLGNAYLISLLASIDSLPEETQNRLKRHVSAAVLFEPPSQVFGATDPKQAYNPLYDEAIPPEVRSQKFSEWVTGYYQHGDLSTRDLNQLVYREPNLPNPPSLPSKLPEEYFDFGAAEKEKRVPTSYYGNILLMLTMKALFDPAFQMAWGNISMWHIYGTSSTWNVIYAAWMLEECVKTAEFGGSKTCVKFMSVEGGNHRVVEQFMHHDPGGFMDCILECV